MIFVQCSTGNSACYHPIFAIKTNFNVRIKFEILSFATH
jgi:hypothetical protein